MDLLNSEHYPNLTTNRYYEVDNIGNGNCLYDSILDCAHFSLPTTHILRSEFPGVISFRRSLRDAVLLRNILVNFVDAIGNTDMDLRSEIDVDRTWGTDKAIQVISTAFDICIIIHSQSDNTWSIVTPYAQDNISVCPHKTLIIRSKGFVRPNVSSGFGGYHYVALIHEDIFTNSSDIHQTIRAQSVKKPSVKKPSVKKPSVNKPSVKKPSVKKSSVRKIQPKPHSRKSATKSITKRNKTNPTAKTKCKMCSRAAKPGNYGFCGIHRKLSKK